MRAIGQKPLRHLGLALGVSLSLWLSACGPESNTTNPPSTSGSVASGGLAQPASYHAAKYDPIHFKGNIEKATDSQCLACHAEVLKPSVRETSPAGLKAADTKAWYQRISTYQGEQDTFHRRHMTTDMAKRLMTMKCTTCHEGNNPRDEAPDTSATPTGHQILRKMVNPETVCLKCHGKMNFTVMGLPESWEKSKDMFQNNCLLCHATIRTNRHNVNYLNKQAIENAAVLPNGGDTCFGCHGGRSWYRLNYPYPRHAWPGMDPAVPDWAKGRMTESEARFLVGVAGVAAAAPAAPAAAPAADATATPPATPAETKTEGAQK